MISQSPELVPGAAAPSAVGITERAVQRIIGDLEEAGVIVRERIGRRNRYILSLDRPLRHPLEANTTIAEVIRVIESA